MSVLPQFRPEHATIFGETRFAQILASCTDVNLRGAKGRTALFLAARVGRDAQVRMLLQRGADPNLTDDKDEAPLQVAARYGRMRCIELLLDAGAKIDHIPDPTKTECSETALRSAVWHQEHDAAVLLLLRGANPNAIGSSKRYPLIAAAFRGNSDLCRRLVEAGAALNSGDERGARPLCSALSFASIETVRTLLDLGADPNAIGSLGMRPLSTALLREEGDCLPFLFELLKAKADINLKNKDNSTAFEWAIKLGNGEASDLFRSLGAKPEKPPALNPLVIDIGDGAAAEMQFVQPRVFTASESDREIAKHLSTRPSGVLRNFGWEASPNHWAILEAAERPLTIDRIAYYARGLFKAPSGNELDDAPTVLGETYMEAATRFTELGLLRTLSVAEAVEKNATGDEMIKLLREHRLRPPTKKDDLVHLLVAKLPDIATAIAGRKTWYLRTDLAAERLSELGDQTTSLAVVRRLFEHLHAATEERNLEGMLLIHLDLLSACREPRRLDARSVLETRRILNGEWPEYFECDAADIPRLRTVMGVINLVPCDAFELLGLDWKRWNYFGPLNAPTRQLNERLGPDDVISELTTEGFDPI